MQLIELLRLQGYEYGFEWIWAGWLIIWLVGMEEMNMFWIEKNDGVMTTRNVYSDVKDTLKQ